MPGIIESRIQRISQKRGGGTEGLEEMKHPPTDGEMHARSGLG